MEGLDHSFDTSMIRRMELKLLQELGWQMNSTTPYSYLEILLPVLDIDSDQLTDRATEFLLGALLGIFVEYQPSTLAVSALWCSLEEYAPSITNITNLFNEDQKDDLMKCHSMMEAKSMNQLYKLIGRCGAYHCPTSPVTVLLKEQIDDIPDDCIFDLSIRKRPCTNIDFNPVNKKKTMI
ncbi:putative cyclin d [Tripterygium wilfordii]|uniref:Putative cyclin d n=2 Tax=Tripterygium wilfordii TaxID=458696 RepID=A0A7J7DXT6_TRIWF|nr:putative cyclin d [Tripterygium wilfordii]